MLQTNGEEPKAGLSETASPRFEHDLSRTPLNSATPGAIQTKLAISQPGDEYEQEADHISDQVMSMTEPHLQRACACGGGCPKCQTEHPGSEHQHLQTKRVQANHTGGSAAPPIVHEALAAPGQPLDVATRAFMEPRFGFDFSRVRVHSGAAAEQSARDVNAIAYTVGHDIVFGAGQYAPRTLTGQHLLAHELAHTVQQSGGDATMKAQRKAQILNRVTGNTVLQRRETGSGLNDPLYMADRKWSSGQGPDDRITGQKLQNWAIARGSFVIRSDESLVRMQEKDGVEAEIVDEIQVLLVDLLWGRDPRDRFDTEISLWGSIGPRGRPVFDQTRLDKFEGSDNARGSAVLELMDYWGPIGSYFSRALMIRYRDSYLEAAGLTPRDMSLEADTEEIYRLRTNPYRHEHRFHMGLAGDAVFRVGQSYQRLHIVDIYKPLGSGFMGPGTVWAYLDGHPLWYYSGSTDLLGMNAIVGEVARSTAESARLAGQLLPLFIKTGGFVLSFFPHPAIMIAGVVLEELGEEGLRDLDGEGRSFKDIAGSAAREILINLVLNKLMGGGGEGKGASEAAAALDKVAEKAASRIRESVEKEIVHSEGPQVVKAVEAGEARMVKNQTLLDEGFTHEVDIAHEGGHHTYRRKANGEWCRWSTRRLCGLGELEAELKEMGGFQDAFEGPRGDIVSDPMEAGRHFNEVKVPKGAHAEVQLRTPSGARPRVDLYIKEEEIISRKFSKGQFANDEFQALEYLQELRVKYPPGAPIASSALQGEVLQGVQVLEVPVQYMAIPKRVLQYAEANHIVIRDIDGKVYATR